MATYRYIVRILTPPPPADGGEDVEKDWVDFQTLQHQEALERLFRHLSSKFFYLLPACRPVMDLLYCLSDSSIGECVSTYEFNWKMLFVLTSTCFLAHFGKAPVLRSFRKHPVRIGIVVQLSFFSLMLFSCALFALSLKSELMRHRVFLNSQLYIIVLMNTLAFLPSRVYLCVGFPVIVMNWTFFHLAVGYLKATVIVWGLFLAAFTFIISRFVEDLRWRQFKVSRQLDRERQVLEETQSTLHCMLSSQFDASGTCTPDGHILSSTPHLDQLLGHGESLVGSELSSFTEDDASSDRLLDFLKTSAECTDRQALSLQCSLQPRALEATTCEVSLYVIRLPPGAKFQSSSLFFSQHGRALFIGIKETAQEHSSSPKASEQRIVDVDSLSDLEVEAASLRVELPSEDDEDALREDALREDACRGQQVTSAEAFGHDIASSAGGTTFTGRAFEGFAKAEKSSDDFRKHLAAIANIGRKEHWLVDIDHVQLCPDKALGAGSFGVVVLGLLHGTQVACKLPRIPRWSSSRQSIHGLRSLVNELRVLRHVRHPNCVLLHGACIDLQSNDLGLLFEYVKGQELTYTVQGRETPLKSSDRLTLLLDTCRAIRYLHALSPQIVHSDLKPSNVLVEELASGLRAKVLDFGLSLLMTKHHKKLGGSIRYMAPEALLSKLSAQGASADVFSWGRLAYFIVTGWHPYQGKAPEDIEAMARRGFFDPLSWPKGPEMCSVCKECRALCAETSAFEASKRPDMNSVHATVLSWVPPDGNCSELPEERKQVSFQDGVADVRERLLRLENKKEEQEAKVVAKMAKQKADRKAEQVARRPASSSQPPMSRARSPISIGRTSQKVAAPDVGATKDKCVLPVFPNDKIWATVDVLGGMEVVEQSKGWTIFFSGTSAPSGEPHSLLHFLGFGCNEEALASLQHAVNQLAHGDDLSSSETANVIPFGQSIFAKHFSGQEYTADLFLSMAPDSTGSRSVGSMSEVLLRLTLRNVDPVQS